ncbi:AAA family ATPase [Phenylobacterium sp.]|uniref:AAA family ATPase n=1 Tax=Phenylobacterium sp. TaxID=1871053 RepID=UPI0025E69934|nr:AAA family ATPase [Phenylobacterium sp.]
MELVFIHGPAAAGKLTVARILAARTGHALFHNHLVVDAVGAVFPFGSPEFRGLREAFWLQTFEAAARAGRSLIFTFAPEATVAPDFADAVVRTVEAVGGRVRFIALACPDDEQDRRIEASSREAFGKLRSLDLLRTLRRQGAFDYPELPAEIVLDTSQMSPESAAARIAERLAAPCDDAPQA